MWLCTPCLSFPFPTRPHQLLPGPAGLSAAFPNASEDQRAPPEGWDSLRERKERLPPLCPQEERVCEAGKRGAASRGAWGPCSASPPRPRAKPRCVALLSAAATGGWETPKYCWKNVWRHFFLSRTVRARSFSGLFARLFFFLLLARLFLQPPRSAVRGQARVSSF